MRLELGLGLELGLTGFGAITDVPRSYAPVHLDMLLDTIKPFPQLPSLFQTLGHELLAARSRVDGHDQDHVGRVKGGVGDR